MLVASVAQRLGIEALAGRLVRLRRERPGGTNAGRKVMALLFAMALGADSIDDCGVLCAGRMRRLPGGWLPAPSTLGTFLRSFTFVHVRQLDTLLGRVDGSAFAGTAIDPAGRHEGQYLALQGPPSQTTRIPPNALTCLLPHPVRSNGKRSQNRTPRRGDCRCRGQDQRDPRRTRLRRPASPPRQARRTIPSLEDVHDWADATRH
jgi:hypothetical protein